MEASIKYPLNPLAACFVPLSMKAHNGDLHSTELRNYIPFYTLKHGAPSTNKTKTIDHPEVRNLDLISKRTTCEDLCFTSKGPEMNEPVHVTPEKIIDESSIDRSEDRTSIEKVDLMERKDIAGNCSTELERTLKMAYENTDPFEIERTADMDENMDSIKMNWTPKMAHENTDSIKMNWTPKMAHENTDSIKMNCTPKMAHENTDSETEKVGSFYTILERSKNLADYDIKPREYESISSTESIQSTRSFQSDYGTDVENIDTEDCRDLLTNFKSCETIEREITTELISADSERYLNLPMKSSDSLSLTALLNSFMTSENGKEKSCSKEILKAGSKLKEECVCERNCIHTTYEHETYDHTACVPTIYRKSLYFENHSIDSGHCSDEDESSSVEVNTLEQCSLELESIIKDVFDCVDKCLSSCEDEKPHTADKNAEIWLTANETEVFQVKDSPIIDDGYHPLLQEIISEDEVDVGEKWSMNLVHKFR